MYSLSLSLSLFLSHTQTRHLYCASAGTGVCKYFLRLTFARMLTDRRLAAHLRQREGAGAGGAAPPRAQGCRESSQHGDDAQERTIPNTNANTLVYTYISVYFYIYFYMYLCIYVYIHTYKYSRVWCRP